ncbi:MAG: hypothetical protein H7A36_05445 [Chlamydiales bacterium]|nr:hypothetical protein [Chlamydiales bacterium]
MAVDPLSNGRQPLEFTAASEKRHVHFSGEAPPIEYAPPARAAMLEYLSLEHEGKKIIKRYPQLEREVKQVLRGTLKPEEKLAELGLMEAYADDPSSMTKVPESYIAQFISQYKGIENLAWLAMDFKGCTTDARKGAIRFLLKSLNVKNKDQILTLLEQPKIFRMLASGSAVLVHSEAKHLVEGHRTARHACLSALFSLSNCSEVQFFLYLSPENVLDMLLNVLFSALLPLDELSIRIKELKCQSLEQVLLYFAHAHHANFGEKTNKSEFLELLMLNLKEGCQDAPDDFLGVLYEKLTKRFWFERQGGVCMPFTLIEGGYRPVRTFEAVAHLVNVCISEASYSEKIDEETQKKIDEITQEILIIDLCILEASYSKNKDEGTIQKNTDETTQKRIEEKIEELTQKKNIAEETQKKIQEKIEELTQKKKNDEETKKKIEELTQKKNIAQETKNKIEEKMEEKIKKQIGEQILEQIEKMQHYVAGSRFRDFLTSYCHIKTREISEEEIHQRGRFEIPFQNDALIALSHAFKTPVEESLFTAITPLSLIYRLNALILRLGRPKAILINDQLLVTPDVAPFLWYTKQELEEMMTHKVLIPSKRMSDRLVLNNTDLKNLVKKSIVPRCSIGTPHEIISQIWGIDGRYIEAMQEIESQSNLPLTLAIGRMSRGRYVALQVTPRTQTPTLYHITKEAMTPIPFKEFMHLKVWSG